MYTSGACVLDGASDTSAAHPHSGDRESRRTVQGLLSAIHNVVEDEAE